MEYLVTEREVTQRTTAVMPAATTWDAFPSLWVRLLDEVWEVVRSNDSIKPVRNVMLYKDALPNVEIGVEVEEPFAAIGRVEPSTLPAGRVATTVHHGDYGELGAAHEAVIGWCERHGLRRAGARWEIYGHWTASEADQEVEVYYLLR